MAVKSKGHVTVSTESLLRYVLSVAHFYSVYTLTQRGRENKVSYDSVTVLRYGGFDVSCFADLIVGVQMAVRAPFAYSISGTHDGARQRSELKTKKSLSAS